MFDYKISEYVWENLPCFIRIYQIDNGVVFDFRLVLSDIGGYGRRCRVIHILQGLQSDGFSRYAGLISASRIKIDILLYRIGAGIFHEVTELGFGNIEAFHAVIVKDGQIDLYELIPNQDAGDGRTYTLLPEPCQDVYKRQE